MTSFSDKLPDNLRLLKDPGLIVTNTHFPGSKQTSDVTDVNSYSRAERVRAPDASLWRLCPLRCDVSSSARGSDEGLSKRQHGRMGRARDCIAAAWTRTADGKVSSSCSQASRGDWNLCRGRGGGLLLLREPLSACPLLFTRLLPPSCSSGASKHQFWPFVMMRIIRLSPASNVHFVERVTCASTDRSLCST